MNVPVMWDHIVSASSKICCGTCILITINVTDGVFILYLVGFDILINSTSLNYSPSSEPNFVSTDFPASWISQSLFMPHLYFGRLCEVPWCIVKQVMLLLVVLRAKYVCISLVCKTLSPFYTTRFIKWNNGIAYKWESKFDK